MAARACPQRRPHLGASHSPATAPAAPPYASPPRSYTFTASTGQHKYEYPLPKLFVLGILAGVSCTGAGCCGCGTWHGTGQRR